MKFVGKFLFWLLIMSISTGMILASYSYMENQNLALRGVISPLPTLLTDVFSQEKSSFWQPNLKKSIPSQKSPVLTAKAALTYDLTTDKLLFASSIDEKLPIASLTKIMTAIIALENLDLYEEMTVSPSAAKIGEGTMGLSEGETLTLEQLLFGLLLQSGNDAGETIAQESKFGRADFLHLMNKKAESLGLSNTRFTNPTGLEGDGEQYGTAKELLVLTRYALTNPRFAEIVSTYQYDIPENSGHKAFTLFNETNLLTTYPGVKGVKTGYTDEAGLCLITYLDYEGHHIIGVLLNSQNRRAEMAELLDYSLKELGVKPPRH